MTRSFQIGGLAAAALAVVACGRQPDSDVVVTVVASLTAAQQRVLSFEAPTQDWSAPVAVGSSTTVADGTRSLSVVPNGWTEVKSVLLASLGPVKNQLSWAIRVPQAAAWGETRMILRVPSRGLYWQDLGGQSLVGMTPNAFTTVTVPLPADVVAGLSATYADLEVRVIINGPAFASPYLLDRIDLAATGGGGGSTAPAGTRSALTFVVPHGLPLGAVMLSASQRLQVDDRVTLAQAGQLPTVASLGPGGTELGAGVVANASVTSMGSVNLRSGAHVLGSVTTAGTITQQNDVRIDGQRLQGAAVTDDTFTLPVAFPATSAPAVVVGPDGPITSVAPGAYAAFDVRSRGKLALRAGSYFLGSFNTEPEAQVQLDTSAGAISIYVRDAFTYKGAFVTTAGTEGRLLVGYLGTATAFLQAPFVGTMIAPAATIELQRPTFGQHRGAWFGARIQVFSDASVGFLPATLVPPTSVADVPPTTPSTSSDPPEPGCGPDLTPLFNPITHEVIAMLPAALRPGCAAATYCRATADAAGHESFTPVAPTPVISSALPIPTAAVTAGCAALPATPECPILGYNGLRARGCEAVPADPACDTITTCPEPGSWDDPNDPDVQHTFSGTSTDSPPTVVRAGPADLLDVIRGPNPFYISPCEWNSVLNSSNVVLDVRGAGKDVGTLCSGDAECLSGHCNGAQPDKLVGTCGAPAPEPDLTFHVREGSSRWHVALNAGVTAGRVQLNRPVFFPSTSFDAHVHTIVDFHARAFNVTFPLYTLDIESQLSECSYNFQWQTERGGHLFGVVSGLVRRDLAAVLNPGDVATLSANSSQINTSFCESNLASLRSAERRVNEAFHNALIATSFYALAGPTGQVVNSAATVQQFIDTYRQAGNIYRTALLAFDQAQRIALDHAVEGRILTPIPAVRISVAHRRDYGIGPFTATVEVGAYGSADIGDVKMANTANSHFLRAVDTDDCIGADCFEIGVAATAKPHANASFRAYLGAGVDLGIAGGSVNVRGTVNLADASLPLAAGFKLRRTTLTLQQFLEVAPALPPGLSGSGSMSSSSTATNGFVVAPLLGQYTAPFTLGGDLRNGAEAGVKVSFLDGNIKLNAEVHALGKHRRWHKTLASWRGIEHEWKIGLGDSGNAIPFETVAGLFVVPNMVLLPDLVVPPTFVGLDPATASQVVNDALDTQVTANDRPYRAHREEKLNLAWNILDSSSRCETADVR